MSFHFSTDNNNFIPNSTAIIQLRETYLHSKYKSWNNTEECWEIDTTQHKQNSGKHQEKEFIRWLPPSHYQLLSELSMRLSG